MSRGHGVASRIAYSFGDANAGDWASEGRSLASGVDRNTGWTKGWRQGKLK